MDSSLAADGKAMMQNLSQSLQALVETHIPQVVEAFGGDDAFGAELKAAVKRFQAAHAGQPPQDLEQLLPHFEQREKLLAVIRPALARFQYAFEHQFQTPTAAELRPYLERPLDLGILRKAKLTVTDGEVGMNMSLSSDDKK
jgi:hypothetical protein